MFGKVRFCDYKYAANIRQNGPTVHLSFDISYPLIHYSKIALNIFNVENTYYIYIYIYIYISYGYVLI